MEQYLLIDSDISIVDGDYELLKALGLIDDEEPEIVVGEDEFEEDDDADDDWDEFETDDDEMYDGWDYLARYGEDAWEKLLQARLARHRNILLRLFTRRLPNLSEQAKNVLFDAFFRSDAFGVSEHNALLDALAHPVEGLSLSKYDELGFYWSIRFNLHSPISFCAEKMRIQPLFFSKKLPDIVLRISGDRSHMT